MIHKVNNLSEHFNCLIIFTYNMMITAHSSKKKSLTLVKNGGWSTMLPSELKQI